jgi:hypothetical protein
MCYTNTQKLQHPTLTYLQQRGIPRYKLHNVSNLQRDLYFEGREDYGLLTTDKRSVQYLRGQSS